MKLCGAGPKGGNMTSVEFYDAKTGAWLTLPRFQIVWFFRLYRIRRCQHFSDCQPFSACRRVDGATQWRWPRESLSWLVERGWPGLKFFDKNLFWFYIQNIALFQRRQTVPRWCRDLHWQEVKCLADSALLRKSTLILVSSLLFRLLLLLLIFHLQRKSTFSSKCPGGWHWPSIRSWSFVHVVVFVLLFCALIIL